ncbi:putative ATP-grasp superfamily ATP-dependent carboligase [Paenibacillus sp. DS2015]|uniref:ATP-grasp domain-containing protein n=1 Tax=Paenibacillus sp. DS2015 TaxID=3373917 RepID=UPI003D1EF362
MGQIIFFNRSKMFPFKSWIPDIPDDLTLFTQVDLPDESKYDLVIKKSDFDGDSLIEWEVLDLHKKQNVQAIVCHSEYDLIRTAKLREYLNLSGQNVKSAVAYRNKIIMKQYARQAGIEVAEFQQVHTPMDVIEFSNKHGYPIVIKPIDGGGSRNTRAIYDSNQCRLFLKEGLPKDIMIESFVDGEMYHVDGLMYQGDILFSSVSRYINGCLSFHSGTSLGSVILNTDKNVIQRLQNEAERTLLALPAAPIIAFHAEFFLTKDDRIVLCEIASRTGGARVTDTIEAAFGINLNREWIRLQCGLKEKMKVNSSNTLQTAGWLVVPPREGILRFIPQEIPFEWVIDYSPALEEGREMAGAISSVDNIASFVIVGDNDMIVEERLMVLDRWFRENIWVDDLQVKK